ncbi:MAG: hypothetical protein F6K40_25170 [Okeania sp. SIO3I5]|uniref:hypothetical protein n=1 Tax=Okeania sp. SIO3I5 TaxID=2607805 RepID=UPI0013BD520A|nr:hypothetical protein [Okeania sp. SIO3I5]NEQ39366.1 hypothetical protein [Okeania sp. SIO3I5]
MGGVGGVGSVRSVVCTGLKKCRVVNILAQTMNEQCLHKRSPTPSFLEIRLGVLYDKRCTLLRFKFLALLNQRVNLCRKGKPTTKKQHDAEYLEVSAP